MKHPKKRFKFEKEINAFDYDNRAIKIDLENKVKPPKDHDIYLQTESGTVIKAFHININGTHYHIPEPDPILIYFNDAYNHFRSIIANKETFLETLNTNAQSNVYEMIQELYKHFGWCNGFVIFLFTSIEAFINKIIPDDYNYHIKKNNRTEVYNKEQIERHLSFDDKYSNVLKDITGRDFKKSYPLKHAHIQNLKDFRDNIIHSKANKAGDTPYDYLFKKALNFKYEETIHAVKDLMNFYEPGYIEDCDCGADY